MASIRYRSGKWQARISRRGEPNLVKTFQSKADALKWARGVEVEWDKGNFVAGQQVSHLTLGDLVSRYLREVIPTMKGAHEDSIRLKALLRRPVAGTTLRKLSPNRIAQFRDERLLEVAPATVVRELAYLSSIINHARREWGATIANPVALVRKPTCPSGRTRILTLEEEQRLLFACSSEGNSRPNRNPFTESFIVLAIETAMRRGELLGLTWNDVDLDKRIAFLRTTKNGDSRTVPLSSRAVATLASMERTDDPRVIPINFPALETNFKRARSRAGLKDVRIHDLRHTATTRLAERLSNVLELSAVTGHRQLAMLKRYYHPNPEAIANKLR